MVTARRQRPQGVLPAGFQWRDGRPRWVPSPTRRSQGWKGVDLKDAWGKWLAKGQAVERADAIAAAVAGWTLGQPVPGAFLHFAPKGAAAGAPSPKHNPRGIGTLLDEYLVSPKFLRLADATRMDYRSKLKRLLETVASPEPPLNAQGELDRARLDALVARLKALDIDLFLPPQFGDEGEFVLEDAYETMRSQIGETMAFSALSAASAWFSWCVKKKRVWPHNPARLVEREAPDGRIRVASWEEITALVKAARAMGHASIADAIILGLDLSWSQQDLLSLTWDQVNADFHVKHRRIKTGVAGNPPLLALGRAVLADIKARRKDDTVQPLHLLICERTGRAWVKDNFRHVYAEVREHARKDCPSVADFQFRDLRDTAITYAIEAGLTIEQVRSRSLHKGSRAADVIAKHYGEIRQVTANAAASQLDEHFAKMGYNLTPPLALPAPGQA